MNRTRSHRCLWPAVQGEAWTSRQGTRIHAADGRTIHSARDAVENLRQRCQYNLAQSSESRQLSQRELGGEAKRVRGDLRSRVGTVGDGVRVDGEEGVDFALVTADEVDLRYRLGEVEDI